MKVLKRILMAIAMVIVIIFGIRTINSYRYPEPYFGFTNQLAESEYPLNDEFGKINTIDYKLAQGYHMDPSKKSSKGIVITFGGSEGSSNYDAAYELYKDGYEVLSLYFFGRKSLPTYLENVPIEFYSDVEEYMENKNIDTSIVTVLGASKGAELALLLTQYYEDIDNLVLYAPSAYVFQGLGMEGENSSWSYGGKPLPYLAFRNASGKAIYNIISASILNYPISFLESYASISKEIGPNDLEWIYKNEIDGEILVFAGGEDTMWNSAESAKALEDNFKNIESHIYTRAGHIFGPLTYVNGLSTGGEVDANLEAKVDSDMILKDKLIQWHK
ncbi:MAG: acyl-CoA thioesterase [Tissierellia bacterium]|nr:acyl-CoA thioesterase [Tissierellia bacterium]